MKPSPRRGEWFIRLMLGLTLLVLTPLTAVANDAPEEDPITDLLGGVTEEVVAPVTETVNTVVEPVTEPVDSVVQPVETVVEPVAPVAPAADVPPDGDGDGAPDATDTCPLVANADQADNDGDGIGNVCDETPDPVAPQPRTVAADDVATTPQDTPVTINVLANDAGQVSTLTIAANPASGSAVANADGSITYAPAAGFAGSDSFAYTIAGADGLADSGQVTVTVTPVASQAPEVVDDTAPADDAAPDVALAAAETSQPVTETAQQVDQPAPATESTATDQPAEQTTAAPAPASVEQPAGNLVDGLLGEVTGVVDGVVGTVVGGVVPLPSATDQPQAETQAQATDEPGTTTQLGGPVGSVVSGVPVAGDLGNSTLPVANDVVTGLPVVGDLPIAGSGESPIVNDAIVASNDVVVDALPVVDDVLAGGLPVADDVAGTQLPAADEAQASTVAAVDDNGDDGDDDGTDTASQQVVTLIGGGQQNPCGSNTASLFFTTQQDFGECAEDDDGNGSGDGGGTVGDDDDDGTDTASQQVVTLIGGGQQNPCGSNTASLFFTTQQDFGECAGDDDDGDGSDGDGNGGDDDDGTDTASQQVVTLVGGGQQNPCGSSSASLLFVTQQDFGTCAEDGDSDGDGDSDSDEIASQQVVTLIGGMQQNPCGSNTASLLFVTQQDFGTCGVDDGDGGVVGPNAVDDAVTTQAGVAVTINVLANDQGEGIELAALTDPDCGSVSGSADGSVIYTPDAGCTGVDLFSYAIVDDFGNTDSGTVTVTITPVTPGGPDAVDDTVSTPEGVVITINVLANDTGAGIEVTNVTNPTSGSVINNANGTITYTPVEGFTGDVTFTYTITDDDGNTDSATVTVTVTPGQPTGPDAMDDAATTEVDTPVTINVLANDEGDGIQVTDVSDPTNGSTTINADGTIIYTPGGGFSGTDIFTYTITDGDGETDTASVTVTVTPVAPEQPVAVDDVATTPQETPVNINVLANDSGDGIVVTGSSDPANGSVASGPGGAITYTPDDGFTGTDTFTYEITDDDGDTAQATVTVTVTAGVPDAPVAVDDSTTTPQDTPVDVSVLANDTGEGITVTDASDPANGTATVNAGGTITYTPDTGFTGADIFLYEITDDDGDNDTATVSVVVVPVQGAPTAVDDAATTPLNTPVIINVLINDAGEGIDVTDASDPANGSVTANSDGTITYTPDTDFTGDDTFTYEITDDDGQTDTATVIVVVTPEAPDLPVAVDDAATTPQETPVDINVLANDLGEGIEVTGASNPANGAVATGPNGTITYTPDDGFTGVDSFTYQITDDAGENDTAIVVVLVTPDGTGGPSAADDAATTPADTQVIINVLINDTGEGIETTDVSDPANGFAVINPDDTITYTPDDGFTGEDTFTYEITNEVGETDTATVTVTVTPDGAGAADAVDDTVTTEEGTAITINVLVNDTGEGIEISDVSDPASGAVEDNGDGTITYTPDADFTGDDTFTYEITDDNGDSDSATVTITVTPAGAGGPDAVDDSATTPEETVITINVLVNDTGEGNETTDVSDPDNGFAVINPDDTITFTPDDGFTGTDTFTYEITDENGASDTATVTIIVTAAGAGEPVAADDSVTTPEGVEITINVLANDSGEGIEVSDVSDPASGTVVDNGDGTITYTPDGDFTGADSFTYEITDDDGQTDSATVTISVTPDGTGEELSAADDTAATTAGTSVNIDVLANDTGQGIEVTGASDPPSGSVAAGPNGTVAYTPDDDFTGTDSFAYEITDDAGETDSANVTVLVAPATAGGPLAVDDAATTQEATAVTINILANDSGEGIEISELSAPAGGAVVDNGDGTVTYTPDANVLGLDGFNYEITDDAGQSATASVTVLVVPATPDGPQAVIDAATTPRETAVDIDVLANDVGEGIEVTDVTEPGDGSVVDNGDGTVSYTPADGFTGIDAFSYQITDDAGEIDTADVTVLVVTAAPEGPVAVGDAALTQEDTPVTIDVLANDSGEEIAVTGASEPANGSTAGNAAGTITYTPDSGFIGVDAFTYEITDDAGATATANVTVLVVPAGAGQPIAVDDTATTPEETAVDIDLLTNDVGEGIAVSDVTDPANGAVVDNGDGSVTYTPDAGFAGVDAFTYEITDDAGETDTADVTVLVVPDGAGDGPTAVDDSATTEEETPVEINLIANDTGDGIEVSDFSDPANGSATENPSGTVTYTPDAGFTGDDTFTYEITDDAGETDMAQVTITVTPEGAGEEPDAVDDTATTDESTPVDIDLLANDTGEGIEVTENSDPANGAVTDNGDGTVTYTPDDGFTGEDTFTYEITDDDGGTDTATVTVTVTPAGADGPTAVDDTATTQEESPVIIDVLANDSGEGIEASGASDPPNGSVTAGPGGTVIYTPDDGFTGEDTFTYEITDDAGATDTATVTVTVTPLEPGAPNAVDDVATTEEETPVNIPVLANDSGDGIEISDASDPTNGSTTANADGTITYLPDDGFTGDDSFTYEITDNDGETDTATVIVTVTALEPGAPNAVDDSATTDAETPVDIDVLANDTGDGIEVTGASTPDNGTVAAGPDDTITYTPDDGFSGTDTFTYEITADDGETDTAAVTVTVTLDGAGEEPNAVDDSATTTQNTQITINVLVNDTGEGIEISDVSDPASGTVVDNSDGTITYTPDTDFTGDDSFTYEIVDDNGDTDTATVAVIVVPAQGAAIAVDDTETTEEDTPVDVDLLANDSGEGIEVTDVSDPTNGAVTDNGDGTVTYTPADGFTGTATFPYEITDDDGETDTAMVTITVTPAGTGGELVAADDMATTPRDTPVEITVLANDSGDAIEISDTTAPANGAATENPSGTVTYTPETGFTGTDSFTYEIADDDGDLDTATVTVTVTAGGAGEGPTAVDDTATTSQDTPVNIDVLANDSGTGIEATGAADPANGVVATGPDGTIAYAPDTGFTGTDTFTYEITADDGGTDAATVTVTVMAGGTGTGPNAVDDVVTLEENTEVTIDVLANDTGEDLRITGILDPASGSLGVNSDGTVTYIPDEDFTGTDVFAYQITAKDGQTDSAKVTTTVVPAPAKNPPVTSGPGGKPPVTGPQVTNLPDTGTGIFADYGTTLRALLFALAVCGMTIGLVIWRRENASWNARS